MARIPRGEDGLRRAADAVGGRPGRVGPQPQRDAHRLVTGVACAQERDGAVDSSAHRDRDAGWFGVARTAAPGRRGAHRSRAGRPGTLVAANVVKPAHGSAELGDPGSVPIGRCNSVGINGEANPGEVTVRRRITDELENPIEAR